MPTDLIVTGANGRLGRMMRKFWDAHWLARGDAWPEGKGGVILNLAGVTDPNGPLEDNVTTAAAAIAEGQRRGAKVFLMSSAAVYGAGDADFRETDTPNPANAYGAAKLRMEGLGGATILRLGNVAGADALLGRAQGLVTLDPENPVRSYIGPATLARVLQTLFLAERLPPILNIASPPPVPMSGLLDAADIAWQFGPKRTATVPRVGLATDLLARFCPLPPTTPAQIVAEWRAL